MPSTLHSISNKIPKLKHTRRSGGVAALVTLSLLCHHPIKSGQLWALIFLQTKLREDQHSYQHKQELPGDFMQLLDLRNKSVLDNQNAPSYLINPLDPLSAPSAMGC